MRAKQEKELELQIAKLLKVREAVGRAEKADEELKKESIKLNNSETLVAGLKAKSDEIESHSVSLTKSQAEHSSSLVKSQAEVEVQKKKALEMKEKYQTMMKQVVLWRKGNFVVVSSGPTRTLSGLKSKR